MIRGPHTGFLGPIFSGIVAIAEGYPQKKARGAAAAAQGALVQVQTNKVMAEAAAIGAAAELARQRARTRLIIAGAVGVALLAGIFLLRRGG